MKSSRFITTVVLVSTAALLVWQYRRAAKLREDNEVLRLKIDQIAAANDELSRPATRGISETNTGRRVSGEQLRELIRLRGEVTTLRRQQDDLRRQLTMKNIPAPPPQTEIDEAWVQQVLNASPQEQGIAAGTLRGKLLRREMTNVSPSELALREELLKRQLNQQLEGSPADFANFQSGFIQNALGISDEGRVLQIRRLIRQTYELAVANGLDIPSKPMTDVEDWVQRRFNLDRAATAQLKELLTPDERSLFDRAFLGVMGVDLGGVGVDKSNYPKGFIAD